MKPTLLLRTLVLGCLAMAALAHADDGERHRGRWGGEPRGWQQPGPDRGRHEGWRAQPAPVQPWQVAPHQQRGGPPAVVPPPVYAPPAPGYRQPPPGDGQPPPGRVQPPRSYGPPPGYGGVQPGWPGAAPPGRWNPQAPRLRPGDALPPEYRQRQFIVNDWRAHRLYAPPPGYQWVQPEPGSYILIGRHGEIVNMLVGQ